MEKIKYRATGKFSSLVSDYVEESEKLRPFIHQFPSLENFAKQIAYKQKQKIPRTLLVAELKAQYAKRKTSDLVHQNINLLGNENCFSITTGHQLCLFTGPLYFIYKIASTIQLCKQLKKQYPTYDFVPVYWMASEDHDFAEINHAHLYGKTLAWDENATGAVGHINTESMQPVLEELFEILGASEHATTLKEIFQEAYGTQKNLAEATACLVDKLFAEEGLVIIDADSHALKKEMIPIFREELLEQSSEKRIRETTDRLTAHYKAQVHPRAINLFYMKDGIRARIVKEGNAYEVLGTSLRFSEEKLLETLENHPEYFSPNVALRPLYQECILPNLAYIGGGGELAYWFQLKDNFEAFEVPFPLLVLRNSIMWIDAGTEKKIDQLGWELHELFQTTDALIAAYMANVKGDDLQLNQYKDQLEAIFSEVKSQLESQDQSLGKAVLAEQQKAVKSMQILEQKMLKAAKRKEETSLNRIKSVKTKLFPNQGLQERHDNFAPLFVKHGQAFIRHIIAQANPLDSRFLVLKENEL